MKKKGLFLTFEGGEGSGKTSLTKMYYNHLQKNNIPSILCNDPSSSSDEFRIMRDLILSKKHNISNTTELMIYLASRAQLVDTIIRPAINDGKVVICDRFFDSTTVYQGYMRGHSLDDIESFNKVVCKEIYPDVTILCDVDAKVGLRRSISRLDGEDIDEGKWEAMGLKFHKEVNKWFRYLANSNQQRFKILDSTKYTLDEMFNQLICM